MVAHPGLDVLILPLTCCLSQWTPWLLEAAIGDDVSGR